MSFWTIRQFRQATAGSWIRRPGSGAGEGDADRLTGVSTDSRAVRPGQVFIALRGERFDGHEFLAAAAGAGAPLLIVDDPKRIPTSLVRAEEGPAILRVGDTLRALGQLAAAYRMSLEGTRVIAVCGSNGKTTTTRLIQSVLATKLRGTASIKSYNNEVGVPLTVLGAKPGDQFLVCEVGTNAPGETGRLARIVRPDIAVITSLGRAHIEFFGTLAEVAREDAAILADLRPGGTAIVPSGVREYDAFLKPVPHVVTFGQAEHADLRLTGVEHATLAGGATGLRITVCGKQTFEVPLLGEHNALNALAAIAVARRLGLDDAAIARGLLAVSPAEMRLNRRTVAGADLFIDCYNSNPESAAAAVKTFGSLTSNAVRRVLVFGDMLELGGHASSAHRELAELVRDTCEAEMVVTVGPQALHIAEVLSRHWEGKRFVMHSELDDEKADRIAAKIRPGDAVLLKGSRGMKLERLVAALERAATARAEPAEPGRISPAA